MKEPILGTGTTPTEDHEIKVGELVERTGISVRTLRSWRIGKGLGQIFRSVFS